MTMMIVLKPIYLSVYLIQVIYIYIYRRFLVMKLKLKILYMKFELFEKVVIEYDICRK